MRRGTFHELCTWLTPALRRQDTRLRPAISVEKRVAIALWKLASLDNYCSMGNQFRVGRSTVSMVVRQVVCIISDVLLQRVIRPSDLDATITSFTSLGFPNCGGAIDGTHIWFPEHQAARFINRKGYCSVVLQGLVDHQGWFMDIYVEWSGRAHNARIFRHSGLCHRLEVGTYFPQQDFSVGAVRMPVCIVADAAYPLMAWLMRPYMGRLDHSQATWTGPTAPLSAPSGFRCLLTRLDMGVQHVPEVIAACCITLRERRRPSSQGGLLVRARPTRSPRRLPPDRRTATGGGSGKPSK
nr:protein ALP1-like [Pelodiscus sinensis]|eukprot:XP_025038126.1 protein ALP1-like [Pelodiscus sinensis]